METRPLIPPVNPILDEEAQTIQTGTNDNGQTVSFIWCLVCNQRIGLENRQHLHVIRCPSCKEWTAIRSPPEGKRYVRCSCRVLLTCRKTAIEVTCPQVTCQRVINLAELSESNRLIFECVYCTQEMEIKEFRKFGRCGVCGRLSCMGANYAIRRAVFCFIIALILFGGTVPMAIFTEKMARRHWALYIPWAVCGILAFSMILRGVFYMKIKTSFRIPL